ncbi:hypothetical protein, partial [Klebsiella michiganensis]|uniref:hypothetical protein n=1 Tax=Klebsiella michiganensis TaxID=1134687 RepID=UPI0015F2508B
MVLDGRGHQAQQIAWNAGQQWFAADFVQRFAQIIEGGSSVLQAEILRSAQLDLGILGHRERAHVKLAAEPAQE